MIVGSARKCRRQNESLKTTTGSAPGPLSMLGLSSRPSTGVAPSSEKKLTLTKCVLIGLSSPSTRMRALVEAITQTTSSKIGEKGNLWISHVAGIAMRGARFQTHQRIGVAHGQRFEEDQIEEAERRHVYPNGPLPASAPLRV